jgi:ABC-2 type transport system permease protein
MAGTMFWNTLRLNIRQVVLWGIGLAILGFLIMVAIPDQEALDSYSGVVGSMPEELIQFMGVTDSALIATPNGFVAFGFFAYGLIVMAVFAVMSGMSITANEEDDGLLDVVLSLPIPRWRLWLERYLAYAVITVLIVLVSFLGLAIGNQVSNLDFDLGRLFEGTLNMIPGTLAMMAMTAFLSVVLPRKSMALGVATAVITAGYFIDFAAEIIQNNFVDVLKVFSVFTYYDSQTVVQDGLVVSDVMVLLVVAGFLVIGGIMAFDRRDVGV